MACTVNACSADCCLFRFAATSLLPVITLASSWIYEKCDYPTVDTSSSTATWWFEIEPLEDSTAVAVSEEDIILSPLNRDTPDRPDSVRDYSLLLTCFLMTAWKVTCGTIFSMTCVSMILFGISYTQHY